MVAFHSNGTKRGSQTTTHSRGERVPSFLFHSLQPVKAKGNRREARGWPKVRHFRQRKPVTTSTGRKLWKHNNPLFIIIFLPFFPLFLAPPGYQCSLCNLFFFFLSTLLVVPKGVRAKGEFACWFLTRSEVGSESLFLRLVFASS